MASRSQKPITVVTSPYGETTVSPPTPTASKPGVFRIEDHRRTVYSDVPLDSQTINELLKLTDIPEISSTSTEFNVRRLEDGSLHIVDPSQPRRASGSQRRPSRTDATLSPNINSSPPSTSPRGSPRASPRSPRTMFRPKILFYHRHDPHYGFTNFSPHPVVYKGKKYPTSEHLFQSFKFHGHRPNLAEHIRTCSERPSVAFSEARRFQPEVRPDWMKINVEKMEETLALKFDQHADLKEELLNTGDAELVEDSDKDAFWGIGADRRGRNELGKALERLRAKLRDSQ